MPSVSAMLLCKGGVVPDWQLDGVGCRLSLNSCNGYPRLVESNVTAIEGQREKIGSGSVNVRDLELMKEEGSENI